MNVEDWTALSSAHSSDVVILSVTGELRENTFFNVFRSGLPVWSYTTDYRTTPYTGTVLTCHIVTSHQINTSFPGHQIFKCNLKTKEVYKKKLTV